VKLLIPIDDSEPSRHACQLAAQFAQEIGDVEVVLLNVRNPPEDYGGLALLEHDVFDRSLRVAKETGVDQILMGTHGHGTLGTFFLGSVAQRVAHLAPMPVTLVK